MSNEITVDKEFFEHLLNCMEKQKTNHPNSQGRYVGVSEPWQEAIDAAYNKARALLSQNAVQVKEPFSYREDPILGHTYTLIWNPAMHPSFSVITVVDCGTGRVAVYDHDNASDYRSQIIHVLALAYKYNKAEISMDTTGIGGVLFDQLKELGIPVKAIA